MKTMMTMVTGLVAMASLTMGCAGQVVGDEKPQEQIDTHYVVERTVWFEGATGSLEMKCEGDDLLTDVHTTFDHAFESVAAGANGWRTSVVGRGRTEIWMKLDCERGGVGKGFGQ